MFEKNIFEKIIRAWELDQNHPLRNRHKKRIPEINQLSTIIETAFLASLKREEGYPITFSIALLLKEDIEKELSTGLRQVILAFDKRLPFTVESITKLAAAFDSRTSALIIEPKNNEKDRFDIWGTMLFGTSEHSFNQIPASVDDLNLSRPDVLIVTATSAGSLLITRGDSQIGRFAVGEFTSAVPNPFTSHAMGNYIIDAIKKDKGFHEHKNLYWHVHRDSVDYLLSGTSSRGHGGTVIIIPENKVTEYREYYHAKYTFTGSLGLEKLIDKMFKYSNHENILFKLVVNKKYSERLDALANLACIDGALILSSRLEVLSFGATLKAPEKWRGEVNIGPDSFGGGGGFFDTSKLGTRHNSAIDFVGACPGSVGFVLSQDGPIRGLVRKDNNTVLCWPDCRVSMFA
jgi:hypothetical protein